MSTTLEPPNAVSLDSVQQSFEQWRCTRTQRRVTPRLLREQAVLLMTNHRRAHICKALRINDQALKKWASQSGHAERFGLDEHQPDDSFAAGKFVELSSEKMHHAELVSATSVTTLRIELVNGAVISTDQSFTLEQILIAARASVEQSA